MRATAGWPCAMRGAVDSGMAVRKLLWCAGASWRKTPEMR